MPGDDLLYPPMSPSPWWWALVAGLLVTAAVLVVVAVVLRRGVSRVGTVGPTVAGLRGETLTAIDEATIAHNTGRLTATEACQEFSRLVRSFAGQAGDGNADFATASRLHLSALADHRLEPTARFTAEIREACFCATARPDVDAFAEQAREVVTAWR